MHAQRNARLGLFAVAVLLIGGLAAVVFARYRGEGFVAAPGKTAADFTLLNAADRPTSLASFHGTAVTMVVVPADADLDAPAAAAIAELADRVRSRGETFLAVSGDKLPQSLARLPVQLRDHAGDVARMYMVLDRPVVFTISADGVIVARQALRDAMAV
jgi:peroxiredoxin